jgi:hypothetical protein
MADDNIRNYALQRSRRLTPNVLNYLKTRVFVFLAAETELTKIYVNIVADVLYNKRCILAIKVMVRSWTVRTLRWQL